MALSETEFQNIVNAVLSSIRTNSRTIAQLTPVTALSDTDTLEIAGGKKVTYGKFKELVGSMLNHLTIAGGPDSVTVSVGANDHSVSGSIPAASDTVAGMLSAAMKKKLDKAAVPEYIEFDGFADSVTAKKMSVSFGSSEDGYKVVFVRELNTFLLCHGIPDPDDGEASGYNNWADGDDFGAFSENGRVPYPKTLYLDRSSGIAYRLAGDGRRLVSIGAGVVRFKGFYFSGSPAQQSSSGQSSTSEGYAVKFMQSTGHFVLAKDDVLNTYWVNWTDAHLFGVEDDAEGYKPFFGRIYLDENTMVPYLADAAGLTPFSLGVTSLAVDEDADDIENIHIKAFDVQGGQSSDVSLPNSEIRRRVVFFDGMQPPLSGDQLVQASFVKSPLSSDSPGCKVYYYMRSFLLTKGEIKNNALQCWADWTDAISFMATNADTVAERFKAYYDRIYIDRSTGLIYIRKNDAGELMQLGSRFSSLSLDDSDKRNYIVKALDESGAVIASVSIPKPAKAPESPVKILAKGICRPTSDPRYAYRLHNNPGFTVIYKLPDKLASEQLRMKYMSEYGSDITVFDVSNLLNFNHPLYGNSLDWYMDNYNRAESVLKKILSGWQKDGVYVSADTYSEDSVPAGWSPVWTHHLIFLTRYNYGHGASFLLAYEDTIAKDIYIFRSADGSLKRTYNIIPQRDCRVSDDLTMSIRVGSSGEKFYWINDTNRVDMRIGGLKDKRNKYMRRNVKYDIQWCHRRKGQHYFYYRAFKEAISAGKRREVAVSEAINGKDATGYLVFNRWSHTPRGKTGLVRIRRKAAEGAPAGKWNYFVVRNLDSNTNVYVKKLKENKRNRKRIYIYSDIKKVRN